MAEQGPQLRGQTVRKALGKSPWHGAMWGTIKRSWVDDGEDGGTSEGERRILERYPGLLGEHHCASLAMDGLFSPVEKGLEH